MQGWFNHTANGKSWQWAPLWQCHFSLCLRSLDLNTVENLEPWITTYPSLHTAKFPRFVFPFLSLPFSSFSLLMFSSFIFFIRSYLCSSFHSSHVPYVSPFLLPSFSFFISSFQLFSFSSSSLSILCFYPFFPFSSLSLLSFKKKIRSYFIDNRKVKGDTETFAYTEDKYYNANEVVHENLKWLIVLCIHWQKEKGYGLTIRSINNKTKSTTLPPWSWVYLKMRKKETFDASGAGQWEHSVPYQDKSVSSRAGVE